MKMFDLTGKVAIVTGSSRGLGQGYCLALAEAGADIFGVDYKGSEETEQKVKALGRNYKSTTANLIDSSNSVKVIDEALQAYGKIDILVNNAGIIRREDLLNFTEQDWDDVININLKTVFLLSQAFANHLVSNKKTGKIINVASMLSFQGGIRVPSYAASKGGVASLTKSFANELAIYGITCNAIAPGYFATDNTAQIREDVEREKSILARIPAGRWGLPEDLMGGVIYLASNASNYVNGHILAIDGGWLAR